MNKMMIATLATALIAGFHLQANAADHQVEMLNRGDAGMMVFEPAALNIAIGDTVTFVPTDKGHNAVLIKGMAPEGFEAFRGKMNEKFTVTFEKPGVYGYNCMPHYGMGMVGVIVVGEPENLADAQAISHPGRAKQRMADMLADLES